MRRKPRPLTVPQTESLRRLNTLRPYGEEQPLGGVGKGTIVSAWRRTMMSLHGMGYIALPEATDGTFRAHITCPGIDHLFELGPVVLDKKARLEAAAPELLAALKMVLSNLTRADDLGFFDTYMEKGDIGTIRAAIAKAEGE